MGKPEIVTPIPGVRQCVDCGAYARPPRKIVHYNTCKSGEAKRWEKYYEEAE